MATAVGLNMKMTADTSGLGRGMTRAEKLLNGIDKNARSAASSLRVIATIQVGGALLKGLSSIAGTLTAATRSAVNYASSLASSIDETAKLAARTGIAVEALQGFQVAADLSGVQNLESAIQRLTITIGDAGAGVKEPQKAFERLGLDFERLSQLKPEDQFRAVAAAFQDVGTQADKAAIAADLFGRSGVELLPLFNSNLAEIEARANRLGIVLGEEQTAAIERMNDALSLVGKTIDGVIGQVLANIADVVTAITEEFLQFVEAFEGVNGAQGGNAIADFITQSVLNGIDGLLEIVRFVGNGFLTFADILSKVLQTLAPFAGVDLRSEAQRRLDALESSVAAQAAAGPGGVPFVNPAVFAEIKRLREQVAKEEEESAGINIRRFFNTAIDAAQDAAENVRQRLQNNRARVVPEEVPAPAIPQNFEPAFNPFAEEALANQKIADFFGEDVPRAVSEAQQKFRDEIAEREAFGFSPNELEDLEKAFAKFNDTIKKTKQKLDDRQKLELERADDRIARAEKNRAERLAEIEEDRLDALSRRSNQALEVSDIRSGGISEVFRLAAGREDPALDEARKQVAELRKIEQRISDLRSDKVKILGGAGAAK